MSGVGRTLFLVVAATAIALVIGSTACTRRGSSIPPTASPSPIAGYYVDPIKGSDTNNGTQSAPFKTITHALVMVKKSTGAPLTVYLNPGAYTRNSGETFPLVIPTGVSLTGTNYGHSVAKGSYINGSGEDTTLEKAQGRPPRSLFTTIAVPSSIALTLDKVYVGTTIPSPIGTYASVDVLGSLSASADTFGQGGRFQANGGVAVAGGTLTCTACSVQGRDFAIKAFSISSSSSSGSTSGGGPTVTLQGPGHSVIGGGDGIRTDGTATITASTQVFQSRNNAYIDSLAPPSPGSTSPSPSPTSSSSSGAPSSGSVDFGGGPQDGTGSNTFVGSTTEINVTLAGEHIYARNNTWNVTRCICPQRTNPSGQYQKTIDFGPGANGQNIKIAGNAAGSIVTVGPAKPPTPTPSPYSSSSPSGSPSPTSSPS